MARAVEAGLSRQESLLSQKILREKEEAVEKLAALSARVQELEQVELKEAGEKVAGLSRKVQELEHETQRKLASMREAFDREKTETDRRMAEQVAWVQRMADQLEKTRRELVAVKGQAAVRNGDPGLLAQGVKIAVMRIVPADPVARPVPPPPVPRASEADLEYFLKQAEAEDLYRGGITRRRPASTPT